LYKKLLFLLAKHQ